MLSLPSSVRIAATCPQPAPPWAPRVDIGVLAPLHVPTCPAEPWAWGGMARCHPWVQSATRYGGFFPPQSPWGHFPPALHCLQQGTKQKASRSFCAGGGGTGARATPGCSLPPPSSLCRLWGCGLTASLRQEFPELESQGLVASQVGAVRAGGAPPGHGAASGRSGLVWGWVSSRLGPGLVLELRCSLQIPPPCEPGTMARPVLPCPVSLVPTSHPRPNPWAQTPQPRAASPRSPGSAHPGSSPQVASELVASEPVASELVALVLVSGAGGLGTEGPTEGSVQGAEKEGASGGCRRFRATSVPSWL